MSTDYLQEPEAPRRRVSIATDPVFETRKLSYVPGDADRNRRISVATDWAMDGSRKPSQQLNLSVDLLQNDGRRRSILRNPHDNISLYSNHPDADISRKSTLGGKTPDTLSLYSHYSNYPQENGKLGVNGDLSPSKKNSTVDSISEKIRYLERESPKHISLVIILTRAGLDLDPQALRKLYATVLKLALVPWLVECAVMAVVAHFLMDLPWLWGFLLGAIIAAVSPAVVVPCLFKLREKGYGVSKGIPTLVIAISAIDDGTSVAVFGVIKSFLFSSGESTTFQIIQGPLSIFGGIAFGVIWGYMSKYIPERHDPFAVPLRILMLLGGGVLAVLGSEKIGLAGAGPLGCIAAAFMCLHHWTQQGWEIEDNPVATAFEIFWMIFEPILFGLTGTQIKIWELDSRTVYISLACLISGILIRLVVTVVVGIGCRLNLKEKIFVALTCMSKAGVQAALGPVALSSLSDDASEEEKSYGQMILTTCVLSILLTAPTGAILISMTGSKLLKKVSSAPPSVAGWRSRRPSIRDITIINEEEDSGENIEAT